jgi:hypothetical protein
VNGDVGSAARPFVAALDSGHGKQDIRLDEEQL